MDISSKKLQKQQELLKKSTEMSLAQASNWDKNWIDTRKKDKSNKINIPTSSSTIAFTSIYNKNSDVIAQAQNMTKKKQKENLKIETKQKKSSANHNNNHNNNNNNKSFLSDQSNESEYEVEKIIDKKIESGKQLYKVKWKGWDYNSCTWEPAENLENVWDLIEEYEESKKLSDKKKGQHLKYQRPHITNIEDEDEGTGVTGELDGNNQEHSHTENQMKASSQIIKGKSISASSKQQDNPPSYINGSASKQSKNAPLIIYDSKNTNQMNKKDEKNYKISIIDNSKEMSEYEPSVQKKHQTTPSASTSTKISMKSQEVYNNSLAQPSSNSKVSTTVATTSFPTNSAPSNTGKKQREECLSEKNTLELETDKEEEDELVIECFFEAIIDKKQLPGEEPQYLIKFCEVEEPAWEYLSNLENLQEEIEEFEQKLKENLKNQETEAPGKKGEQSHQNQDRQDTKSSTQQVEQKKSHDKSGCVTQPSSHPNGDSFEMEEEEEEVEEEDDQVNAENQVEEGEAEAEIVEKERDTRSATLKRINSVDENQQNLLSSLGNITEAGCYFKGDKSQYIKLVEGDTSDLFKSFFKVFWKPRSNNIVPQPSYFSYQLIKELDSKSLIDFYEKIYEKKQRN